MKQAVTHVILNSDRYLQLQLLIMPPTDVIAEYTATPQ
jgi:hypothetical protein